MIAGRRLKDLEEAAAEVRALNKDVVVVPVRADIVKEEDVKNLFEHVQKVFGRSADVLLNNAGVLKDGPLIGEQSVDDWWQVMVSILPCEERGRIVE